MSQARFKSIFSGVTAVAQKVYGVVPISEPWSVAQISSEHARNGGLSDVRVVHGCLRALCEARLVSEVSRGMYVRVKVKERPDEPKIEVQPNQPTDRAQEIEVKSAPKAAPKVDPAPLGKRLSDIATSARSIADSLIGLANEVELAALEMEDQLAANDADTQKLKQLQALLKSLA